MNAQGMTRVATGDPRAADAPGVMPSTPAWLGPFFWLARLCPSVLGLARPLACAVAPIVSSKVRRAVASNTFRIYGRTLSAEEQAQFARRVVGSFFDFVVDVGRSSRMSKESLSRLVEDVQGLESYRRARSLRKGAILVTAHLGTFEAGLAALAGEEKRVHVVFKRDASPAFEKLRARLHQVLGVVEAPIDDGMGSWLALRDALQRDEVVVMQGDRAVPGQRSQVVEFLHGHVRLPTGPVRLAMLTEAPIVPVFALPTGKARYRVELKEPIHARDSDGDGVTTTLTQLADAIADVVAANPHQWLALDAMFHEDTSNGRD